MKPLITPLKWTPYYACNNSYIACSAAFFAPLTALPACRLTTIQTAFLRYPRQPVVVFMRIRGEEMLTMYPYRQSTLSVFPAPPYRLDGYDIDPYGAVDFWGGKVLIPPCRGVLLKSLIFPQSLYGFDRFRSVTVDGTFGINLF